MPRVLVVEDEPLIALMLRDWLAELGCETVGPVDSVQGALALLTGNAIDCAILDVSLKGEDCYPVADALRARGVPIAFATGHEAPKIDTGHAGALTLSKPYDFEGLGAVVAKLLGRASALDMREGA